MHIVDILAAAAGAPPKNQFGFMEALEQGGFVAYATVAILAIMSFGSFYILFTKWFEQSKVMKQGRELGSFLARELPLRTVPTSSTRTAHGARSSMTASSPTNRPRKLTDETEAHDWLHGSLARSEDTINAKLASGLPFPRHRRRDRTVHRPVRHSCRHLSRADQYRPRRFRLDRQGRRSRSVKR